MHATKSPAGQTRGSIPRSQKAATLPLFKIDNLREVSHGRIRARFDLTLGPITLVDCVLVVDADDQPQFCAPARVKESFSGVYQSTVRVERSFMNNVFDAVVDKLRGAAEPETRARLTGDAWAEDQEARFERALAALDA